MENYAEVRPRDKKYSVIGCHATCTLYETPNTQTTIVICTVCLVTHAVY